MVNEEKLRVMTRLASYEKNTSEKKKKEGGYYKSDYIRAHLLVTIWSYSVAFCLLVALIALYHFDYLVSAAGIGEMRSLILAILAIYSLLMLGCVFFTITVCSKRYTQLQRKKKEYYRELRKLELFYRQSREEDNA